MQTKALSPKDVTFVVNGKVENRKVSPPYSFTFITHEPGDYEVYAVARDMTGNTIMSNRQTFQSHDMKVLVLMSAWVQQKILKCLP